MTLKAITYNYTQDGIIQNKVVGIFEEDQITNALKDIRSFYELQGISIVKDSYDESCDNYFIQFDNEESAYYYTSDYIVNELNL